MVDIIIIAIVVAIVAFAGLYVYKAKKSGKKCIGCPDGCSCSKNPKPKKSEDVCDCGCCSPVAKGK